MQTAPISEVTNLIPNPGSGSARTSAAKDLDAASGQTAQPKAGNSSTPDRRGADNDAPRPGSAASEAGAAGKKSASRARTPDAKTKEAAGPNASARPRGTVAGNEVLGEGRQAAAGAISEACARLVFAAVLQQVGQAQAAQMAGAATPAAAPGEGVAVPVMGGQGPSVQPLPIQGQMLKIENVVTPSQMTPTQPQQSPQATPAQVPEQPPLLASAEAKPNQTLSNGGTSSNGQPTPAPEAKTPEAALKPESPAEHPAVAVPVKVGQGTSVQPLPNQGQMLKIENAVAPSQVTPTQPQQSPQATPAQVPEQPPLLASAEAQPNQTLSNGGTSSNGQPTPAPEAKTPEAALKPAAPMEHPAVAATVAPLQGQQQATAANAAAPDHSKVVEAYKTGQKQNGRREPASTASTQAGKLNQTQTAHGDAAAASRAADGAASVQSQTAGAQGPVNQASDHPLVKAAEASIQNAPRGTPQTELAQQTAETPVADQIVQSIRAAGVRENQQIVVNLTPPELGKVRVTLRSSGHEIRGVLEADNPDTLRRLEREAAGLTQRLGDAGLDVRRMDVVMTRQDGQATSQNPNARGDGSGQQPDAGSGSTSRAAPAAGQGSPEETTAAGMDVVTSGSINVRI